MAVCLSEWAFLALVLALLGAREFKDFIKVKFNGVTGPSPRSKLAKK